MEGETVPVAQPSHRRNTSRDLPDWNESLKILSPHLPRNTPGKAVGRLGPPQVSKSLSTVTLCDS